MDQETATAIRRTYHEDSNITLPDLVVMYGVSRAAVKRILRHETWRIEEDRELYPYGEREYQFGTLTKEQAREARREYFETRVTLAELAIRYGMTSLPMRKLLQHRSYFSKQDKDDYPYEPRDFTGRKPLSETDIAQMRQGKWEEGLEYEELAIHFNHDANIIEKICTYKKYPNLVHESRWSECVTKLSKDPNWMDEIGRKMKYGNDVRFMLLKLKQGVAMEHVLNLQYKMKKPMEYWLTVWELLYLRLFYIAKDKGTTTRALREEAAKINVPKLTISTKDM